MKYFRMNMKSRRYSPIDFGLVYQDGKFIDIHDGSVWKISYLYDFGWGREEGYYREPLGDFNFLLGLIFNDNNKEDAYGAAAIIIYNYIDKLYLHLLTLNKKEKSFFIEKTNEFFRFDNLELFILPNSTYSKDMWKKLLLIN